MEELYVIIFICLCVAIALSLALYFVIVTALDIFPEVTVRVSFVSKKTRRLF